MPDARKNDMGKEQWIGLRKAVIDSVVKVVLALHYCLVRSEVKMTTCEISVFSMQEMLKKFIGEQKIGFRFVVSIA